MSAGGSAARVTVFVPTYNRAHWLRHSIQSVLAQTYEDFVLVVRDNASTDETTEVLSSFSDPRLRYVRNQRNVGLLENHNACLREVDTDYALILPDDDLLGPEHLASTVAVLDANPGVGMVHTAFDVVGPGGQVRSRGVDWTYGLHSDTVETGARFIQRCMVWSCRVCPSTALMRTAAIHPDLYLEEELPGIDFGMWLRMALDWHVAFLCRSLGAFRVHGSSYSANFDQSMGDSYNHGIETITGVKGLKQRFLHSNAERLDDVEGLSRLAETAMRRELVQMMRNTTVPERGFVPTVQALRELAHIEPRVLGEVNAWRLVVASLMGRRATEWITSHTRPAPTSAPYREGSEAAPGSPGAL